MTLTDPTVRPYDQPGPLNEACQHPIAEHRHGCNATYHLDGCRCDPCKAAQQRYARHRRLRTGPYAIAPSLMVSAVPARRHVRQLIAGGMGLKRIAEVSGVPHGALWKLTYRRKRPDGGYRMSAKLRRVTADRILNTVLDVADGARVDATEAWLIVAELVARGWTKRVIADRIGRTEGNWGRGTTVTAGTLRALRLLLTEPVPDRRSRHGTHPVKTGHRWRTVEPSTPGVPAADTPAAPAPSLPEPARRLTCNLCGQPLADHSLTRRCAA